MPPRVSIIVPVFNGSRFVLDLIDTVRAQTLSDWELIIADDGSTDDLDTPLARAPLDERRHLVRQPNLGLARARNRALAEAAADLVAFLDVDDAWQPTYLATMCAALEQAPRAVAAFCGWQYMDAAGQPLPQTVVLSQSEAGRLAEDLTWRNSLVPSGVVARRPAVLHAGGFDESMPNVADWDLWLKLIASGPFVAMPQALTWYRTHTHSMSENLLEMERGRLRLHAKHLGPLDEPVTRWPDNRRRAVGFTYFTTALGLFAQNAQADARERIRRALEVWPGLLDLDDFYYELGCAGQPRGLRGTAEGLNLKDGAALIHSVLFDPPTLVSGAAAARHWGHACLVLARLARNTGQWSECRRYAWRGLLSTSGSGRLKAARLLARSLAPAAPRPTAPTPRP
jgi:glycosyltransferase involved in cell wall biosynthesis